MGAQTSSVAHANSSTKHSKLQSEDLEDKANSEPDSQNMSMYSALTELDSDFNNVHVRWQKTTKKSVLAKVASTVTGSSGKGTGFGGSMDTKLDSISSVQKAQQAEHARDETVR